MVRRGSNCAIGVHFLGGFWGPFACVDRTIVFLAFLDPMLYLAHPKYCKVFNGFPSAEPFYTCAHFVVRFAVILMWFFLTTNFAHC